MNGNKEIDKWKGGEGGGCKFHAHFTFRAARDID